MESNSYRVSNSRDEILKVLNQKFQNNGKFLVWQKNPNSDKREFMIEADFKTIDMNDGIFTVSLSDEDKQKFNRHIETYFLLKGQDFAFKTKLSIVQPQSPNVISFQSPREVRLIELRSAPRIYFDESDFKKVEVTFQNKTAELENVQCLCRVSNISQNGICIIITKETLSTIDLKQDIEIKGLSFFENLPNVKNAIVRNARVYTKKNLKSDELYAIGLEFI